MQTARRPKLCRHRGRNLAYVRQRRRMKYLGRWGSPEAEAAYDKILADWRAEQDPEKYALTVGDLTERYLTHSEGYYRKDGRITDEVHAIRDALRRLNAIYRDERGADLSPKRLKEYQKSLIEAGLARTTINQYANRVRRMVRWAISEELIPAGIITALQTVPPLKRGRCAAREPTPVRPVPEADVNAVLSHVSRQVRDMIRLQLLTGCRPDEIVGLRQCDIDRDGDVWEAVLESHKCVHHAIERQLYFGPRAQAILSLYLDNRPADAYCFSPREAVAQQRAELRQKRKSKVQPSQVDRSIADPAWKPGERYTTDSYRRAIRRGCDLAGIAPWAPNRLRHSRLTDLRREYGVETAQAVAGHTRVETTQIYAEMAAGRARDAMAEVG